MKVHSLEVSESTIMIEGDGNVVALSLSEDGTALDCTADVQVTTLKTPRNHEQRFTSISPDLLTIAEVRPGCKIGTVGSFTIYDTNTGEEIGRTEVDTGVPWFSPDGRELWFDGDDGKEKGWELVKIERSSVVKLVTLTGSPPEDRPWKPPPGYTVTNDRWISNCEGGCLTWLSPELREDERRMRVWSGRFLGLLHGHQECGPFIVEMLE